MATNQLIRSYDPDAPTPRLMRHVKRLASSFYWDWELERRRALRSLHGAGAHRKAA